MRRATPLTVLFAAAVLAGCGGSTDDEGAGAPPAGQETVTQTPPPVAGTNKRDEAVACFRSNGIDAQPSGEKSILVEGRDGPRVDFFQSSLEAEGEQFEGRAEGAEQIGAALMYVADAEDELLEKLEYCLNEQ